MKVCGSCPSSKDTITASWTSSRKTGRNSGSISTDVFTLIILNSVTALGFSSSLEMGDFTVQFTPAKGVKLPMLRMASASENQNSL